MISGLHQPDSRETALPCPPHYVLHQPSSDGRILQTRINRDRADAGDHGILPKEVTADYPTVNLRSGFKNWQALSAGYAFRRHL